MFNYMLNYDCLLMNVLKYIERESSCLLVVEFDGTDLYLGKGKQYYARETN